MPNIFTTVPIGTAKRNKFLMRNQNSFTCDFGQLIPIYCEEVNPNDTWRGNTQAFVEFMPMTFPVRADVDVFVHHFFVPYRLIWNDFEEFMTGIPATKIDSETPYVAPVEPCFDLPRMQSYLATAGGFIHGSLADYLGYPTVSSPITYSADNKYLVSILPFRAYQKIFNDWYNDKNLADDIPFLLTSGEQTVTSSTVRSQNFILRYRNWRKDYFTSALPYAQRGGSVEIQSATQLVELQAGLSDSIVFRTSDGTVVKSTDIQTDSNGNVTDGSGSNIYFDPVGSLGVSGTLFSVEDLRNYLAVQRQFELDGIAGTGDYIDWVLANFKVQGDDLRHKRCQYLGGSKTPVIVSSVRQTSATDPGVSGLGEQAGVAVSSGGNNSFQMHFKEHGIVMSILSVMPKSTYFQGIPRKYLHRVREDYFLPMFQHLGEQAIKSCEIYYDGTDTATNNEADFGYAPRYAEYKWKPNEIHGQMKSTLIDYNMARNFANRPVLNSNFLAMTPDQVAHVFANISTSDFTDNHLIVTCYNDFSKLSVMKRNPQPKII